MNLIAVLGHSQISVDSVKCYNRKELQSIVIELIKGKESQELLIKTNKEVDLLDQENKLINMKLNSCDSSIAILDNRNTELKSELSKSNLIIQKESKRKRIWRSVAISSTGVLAVLVTFLLIK